MIALVASPVVAMAATSSTSTGTSSLSATAGTLSIGATTAKTVTAAIGGTGTGILPQAVWSDTTGSGDGWNGTVAISDLTYTGPWAQTAGTATALGATTISKYTGTADGVEYTVTVGTGATTSSTPYTWTSNRTTSASKTGTATNGTPATIGLTGVSIDFASGTAYPAGATYEIKVGTESSSAFTLDTSATGAAVTANTGTTSTDPTFVNNSTTLTGGGVTSTSYGAAVKFVTAAVGTGMGSYTVDPGISVSTDPNTWAATYTAGVQYSIVTGP